MYTSPAEANISRGSLGTGNAYCYQSESACEDLNGPSACLSASMAAVGVALAGSSGLVSVSDFLCTHTSPKCTGTYGWYCPLGNYKETSAGAADDCS